MEALMPASPENTARTRAFARVIGPFLVIVPGALVLRADSLSAELSGFLQSPILVWISGAMILVGGLAIIAFHQVWSSISAIIISVFGWLLVIRGVALLFIPQFVTEAATAAFGYALPVRIGFSLLVLAGLWLTRTGWISTPSAKL
jgi:hypothetical protein